MSRKEGNHPDVIYLTGDFNSIDWRSFSLNYDAVFLLVNPSHPRSLRREEEFGYFLNSTIKLCEALKNNPTRLIFFSSGGSIYGNVSRESACEEDPLCPISSYGLQKKILETVLGFYREVHNVDSLVLRVSNPYGPYQNVQSGVGFISTLVHNTLNNKVTRIFGSGENIRDYIYIQDVVSVCQKSLFYTGRSRIFNVGSGIGYSIQDVVNTLKNSFLMSPKIVYEVHNIQDVRRSVLNVHHTEKELVWSPQVSLKEGMRRTIEHFKSQTI